ncbi:Inosine-5'-monophosphate dehydrogenase protein [Marine Group I thaumarchaeote SCGC AAA799-B03]|uniref:Inosine-5'-monophosphate dehydrogenase protein n=4 Tax=Marine Group I TaxID=905826 RepID=A0A087S8D9_9ARCH|nr:Inosine-5'-monophosphate dehydrogenase protein [Marine Group I thaumarchaeote SCGC AAA799-N04]KFM18089.1 putative manganese-dependent inorganic pyrophosphatase protein [Marine Group I thaumarchaeote SCGC RSA3]KFM21993.1 Inosine-5'-monophosphate dehydrogenase protein [Marine Group I thaumarchaeote SCGC AAA799-B03]
MAHVRDIMQKNVITIEHDKTVHDAAVILKEKEISFLVIMSKGKPVGVVSERDIVQKVAVEDAKASSVQLEDVMSKKFRWVSPDTPIEEAVQKMLNNNIRRLIILDNDENLAGVITQTNLAEFLRSKLLINGMLDNIDSEKA